MPTGRRLCRVIAGILTAGLLVGSPGSAGSAEFDEHLQALASEIAGGAEKKRIHRLAVEHFVDQDGNISRLSRVLATELAAELASGRSFQVIDQQQVVAYLGTQRSPLLSSLSRERLARAGKDLGIDAIVAGSVIETTSQVRLIVKLIAVRNGSLAATARATLPKSGLLAELAGPESEPSPQPLQNPESSPARSEGGQAPQGMALIPAGPFLYGEGDQQRTITLPAFWIDLFEVTNTRYAKLRVLDFEPIAAHRPVSNISWNQAKQYCLSQGKRLPTEQEWEKAARGEDGRRYPWGNTFDPAVVNAGSRERGTTDVGKFEDGRSPYGLYDMAGNVMEWTDSGDDLVRVYRGGSWASPPSDVRTTSRGSIAPGYRLLDLGFRCAMDGSK